MKDSFLKIQQDSMQFRFWSEEYKNSILKTIEGRFKTEILREWGISDFIPNGDKILLKWYKRHRPLTDEELKDQYGR